ncbi:SDR family oxidoreductase [Hufsiella ginkgonis]|uniref:NmrA family NAD(P)-binding protein n=1 Tax=Hufsiella ginkgonis TaxID=2695274 RepID=A0A7K1Y1Y0_9SPHI|nr:SDR family oxidoreductase [Hufsiella ginkgonis]MXV17254.1 NmrA family NAD(P)-binding protein [Hufsiella ginkgonis]
MILVTGASGHLGSAVIDFLLQKVPASQLAVLVRSEEKGTAFKEKGITVRTGDYLDKDSLVTAFNGVEKLLFISSSALNGRKAQHLNVVSAAQQAGVKFIAYTGVATTKTSGSAFQWFLDDHFDTDQAIRESGITYALLHHTLYADFLPVFTGPKAADTGIRLPAGNGAVPFAARTDMAEAAANVITGAAHENKEYNIGLPVSYSFAEVAKLLSEVSGKEVSYTDIPADAFKAFLESIHLPEEAIAVSVGFIAAIKANELDTPSGDLRQLLGREPKSLKEVIAAVYK